MIIFDFIKSDRQYRKKKIGSPQKKADGEKTAVKTNEIEKSGNFIESSCLQNYALDLIRKI